MESPLPFQVVVVLPTSTSSSSSSFALTTTPGTTTDALASAIIARETSLPATQQVLLLHGGRPLPVGASTLEQLGIQSGATIGVHPALNGGCGCSCCTIL